MNTTSGVLERDENPSDVDNGGQRAARNRLRTFDRFLLVWLPGLCVLVGTAMRIRGEQEPVARRDLHHREHSRAHVDRVVPAARQQSGRPGRLAAGRKGRGPPRWFRGVRAAPRLTGRRSPRPAGDLGRRASHPSRRPRTSGRCRGRSRAVPSPLQQRGQAVPKRRAPAPPAGGRGVATPDLAPSPVPARTRRPLVAAVHRRSVLLSRGERSRALPKPDAYSTCH